MSDKIVVPDLGSRLKTLEDRVGVLSRTARFPTPPSLVLGYVSVNADQSGIGAGGADGTPVTGLSESVVVGTNRVIRAISVTKLFTETAGGTPSIAILMDGTRVGFASLTVPGPGVYLTLIAIAIVVAPSAGAHVFSVNAWTNTGTITAFSTGTGKQNYLLVEDIGVAP